MAINISITRSNSLVKDSEDFAYGIIKDIRVLEETENDEYELRNVLEFLIEAEGALEPINLSFRTGSKLNAEPREYGSINIPGKKGRKEKMPIYNNFTAVCLNCGVLKNEDLNKLSSFTDKEMLEINERVNALVGTKVKWNMISKEARDKRTGKLKNIPVIDIQSIRTVLKEEKVNE